MAKRSLFLTLVVFFTTLLNSYSQITTVIVDPGPYTPGSSIAATFKIDSASPNCIRTNNDFELYLSDANGNFVSPTPIGTYKGFYSTFVNGTIPYLTPAGTNYQLRIKSTSLGTFTGPTIPITIVTGKPAVEAKLTSLSTIGTNPTAFGSCNTDERNPLTTYSFNNESTAANATVSITNELATPPTTEQLTFSSKGDDGTQIFDAKLAHYTMYVKAIMTDGTIGTKAYFLVNNLAVTAFTTTSGNTVCFPTGTFEYRVTTSIAENGIGLNFPGNIYQIDWGDGNINDFTYCDIVKNGNKVSHSFSKSSCGLQYTSGTQIIYNAFAVNVGLISPFCAKTGAPLSTPARVVTRPKNEFIAPTIACLDDEVLFRNSSTAGEQGNISSAGCSPNNMSYTWWVDGVAIASNKPRSFDFKHTFTTNGPHVVKLTSNTLGGGCVADDFSLPICIQKKPTPIFTLPATTICLSSGTITPTNNSIFDNICIPNVTYTWNVSPSTGVTYNVNANAPQFTFTIPGIYNITLKAESGACAAISLPQRVVVNAPPFADMSGPVTICKTGPLTFDASDGITKTIVSGTQEILPATYFWEVSGGAYSFVGSSTPNSQYPTINFSEFKIYTVKLTHTNNCGTFSDSQEIKISAAPVPEIDLVPQICYDASVTLNARITNGSFSSYMWSSTAGGTFTNTNTLTPTFTPSPAERDAGSATITLMVNTGIEGECKFVPGTVTILISPKNSGRNAAQEICSGTSASYDPSSSGSLPLSTFKWTARNLDGNATGFSTSTGTGIINETLLNISPTVNAVVVYEITPMANNCDGIPFTFTVTIYPKPSAIATAAEATICSGKPSGISLTPTLLNTKYTWISSATGGITGQNPQLIAAASTSINDVLINTGPTQGTVTYDITPVYNDCPGVVFSITIKVDPAITDAKAGLDEEICATNVYTLAGNPVKTGETGTWTLSSGPNAITFIDIDEHSPTTTAQGLVAGGTYVFKWTITGSGVCDPTSDEVSIHVNEPTVAGIINGGTVNGGTTVCSGTNTGQINLTGNRGSVVEWKSSIDNGLTWQTAAGNNTTGTLTYNNLTTATQYYAVVKNGSCPEASTNTITINVAPPTSLANAGPDQELCEVVSADLSANAPAAGESGRWEYVSGPAAPTIVSLTDPETKVTNLQIGGTYEFKWIITGNAPCGPTEDFVIIKSLEPIDQSISNPRPVICYDQTIHITGIAPTGGNGVYTYIWESKTPTGSWTVIPNETGPNLDITLRESISFRRIVNSGSCTKTSNETDIIVQPPITNNVISADQSICNDVAPAVITGTTPVGSDGNFFYIWESSTDGGATWANLNSSGPDYQAPRLTTTTAYRRIAYTTICNGAQRSISIPVTITVRPDPIAFFTATNQTGCAPFLINSANVRAAEHPLINDIYTWYINDVLHNTGPIFSDYTITENGQPITIKLVVTPKVGCNTKEYILVFNTRPAVPASFTQSDTEICGPAGVRFVNTSLLSAGATFLWDFGNGQTSTQANPAPVNFNPDPAGRDLTYTISLTSTTPCGSNTVTSTLLVKAVPIAVFSPSKTVGCSPMLVNFSNTSPGGTNTYTYDFGDGSPTITTTNKLQPISHTYNTTVTTTFVATMTAVNDCGTDIKRYNIQVSPQNITPELVVDANEKKGCAPLTVNFDNNSIGATHFTFDFGDGGTMNTTAPGRVQHIFTKPGKYTITMTAFNNCSEIIETEEVEVLEQPLAAFNADITLGCAGLAVQFKNTTQDGFSYVWDFGDGTTSNEFEPRHVYNGDKEYYTVTLTATNTLGCSIAVSRNQYIHIVPPPVAAFFVNPSTLISIPDYTFKFEDESTNGPTTWAWDFGDGTTSEKQHPIHTYPDTGTYKVTLTTFNQQGCFTSTFKHVTIKGVPGYLFVPNSFIPGSEYPELRTFSAKGSGIATWKFSVFNKWAELVWETTKLDEGRPAEGWDGNYKGSPAPQGVYYWKIDVKMINGTEWKGMTYDKSAPKRTGAIHLIR